jgi:hypothetical protein
MCSKAIYGLAYWFISVEQFVKYFDISLKLVNAIKWVASIRHFLVVIYECAHKFFYPFIWP